MKIAHEVDNSHHYVILGKKFRRKMIKNHVKVWIIEQKVNTGKIQRLSANCKEKRGKKLHRSMIHPITCARDNDVRYKLGKRHWDYHWPLHDSVHHVRDATRLARCDATSTNKLSLLEISFIQLSNLFSSTHILLTLFQFFVLFVLLSLYRWHPRESFKLKMSHHPTHLPLMPQPFHITCLPLKSTKKKGT